MENASKALLMAGGVLIAIVIISLLMIMINNLTSYQQTDIDTQTNAQDLEFNQQFENYNREDVRGNDLYSLINRAIDYNERQSTLGNGVYEPITIKIDFDKKNTDFTRDNQANQLFKSSSYSGIEMIAIVDEIEALKSKDIKEFSNNNEIIKGNPIYLTEEMLNNLINGYGKIYTTDYNNNYENTSEEDLIKIADTFNNLIGVDDFFIVEYDKDGKIKNGTLTAYPITSVKFHQTLQKMKVYNNSYKNGFTDIYYEYVQFKRGIFKCTKVKYSPMGRIVEMDFKFTGEFN